MTVRLNLKNILNKQKLEKEENINTEQKISKKFNLKQLLYSFVKIYLITKVALFSFIVLFIIGFYVYVNYFDTKQENVCMTVYVANNVQWCSYEIQTWTSLVWRHVDQCWFSEENKSKYSASTLEILNKSFKLESMTKEKWACLFYKVDENRNITWSIDFIWSLQCFVFKTLYHIIPENKNVKKEFINFS